MSKYMLALLPLLGACAGGPDTDGNNNGGCEAAGTCPCEGSDCGSDTPIGSFNIVRPSSDASVDVPGADVNCPDLTCVVEVYDEDVHTVTLTSDTEIYLPKEAKLGDTLTFDQFGDHGYDFGDSANPTLFCDKDGDTVEVYTATRDDAVRVWGLPVGGIPMLGYDFNGEVAGHDGYTVLGTYTVGDKIHFEYLQDGSKYDEEDFTLGACQ